MSGWAGVLPAVLTPLSSWCSDLVKFGCNGCHSKCCSGCIECENPLVDVGEEDLRERLEDLEKLQQEIDQALARYREKL